MTTSSAQHSNPRAPTAPGILATVAKNVTANWIGLAANLVLSFIIAPITVNALGNVYYGIWTLLMQFTGYLWLFDFGVRESVVKYVAQHHAADERNELVSIVRTAVSLYTVVAVLAMFGVIALTVALPHVFNIPPEAVTPARIATFITGATIAQSFVFNVFVGVVMGLQRFYRLTHAGLAFSVFRTALIYVLLTKGFGIIALAAVQFFLSLAFSILILRLCFQELPYLTARLVMPAKPEVLRLLNYGKYVLIANVGDKIVFGTDSIVIAAFQPVSALTFYAIGGSLLEYLRSFVNAMGSVINPVTSGLEATRNVQLLSRVFQSGSKAAVLLGLPVCVGFMTLGERFISIWMGPDYGPQAGMVLSILAVGYVIGLPYRSISAVMYGLGQHHYVAHSRIAEGLVNLGLSVALIDRLGLAGVALGTALPHAIIVGGYLPTVLPKFFPINLREYYTWTYARPFIAATPFALLCIAIDHFARPESIPTFLMAVSAALPAYVLPAWLIALDAGEKARVLQAVRSSVGLGGPLPASAGIGGSGQRG